MTGVVPSLQSSQQQANMGLLGWVVPTQLTQPSFKYRATSTVDPHQQHQHRHQQGQADGQARPKQRPRKGAIALSFSHGVDGVELQQQV